MYRLSVTSHYFLIHSTTFNAFHSFHHVSFLSYLASFLFLYLCIFIYHSLPFISFQPHFASLFTYSFCFDSLLLSIPLCSLFCPLIPFYSLLCPLVPFNALLRALALSVAMMVYGKEEGADSLIEQLSKDRGETTFLHPLSPACHIPKFFSGRLIFSFIHSFITYMFFAYFWFLKSLWK